MGGEVGAGGGEVGVGGGEVGAGGEVGVEIDQIYNARRGSLLDRRPFPMQLHQ